MNWINWGSETPEQLEQRRRFEEEAMEWARAKMITEALAKGQSQTSSSASGGGGGSSVTTTTTVAVGTTSTTTTTTAQPTTTTTTTEEATTTTTTTEEPTTTTTTTEDPNWVELTFSNWTWVEANIGARGTLANWNSAIISASDSEFSSILIDEGTYSVKLYGGAGIVTQADCFNEANIVSINDNGNAIVELGSGSFELCSSLESVTLSNLMAAGNIAFKDCTALTLITLPVVSSLGNSCFEGCTGITSFSLASVVTVGDRCFKGCTSATSFDLTSATSIGTGSNSYTGTDEVFSGISGNVIAFTVLTVPTDSNGAYEEDLFYLLENNDVTINGYSPNWVTLDAISYNNAIDAIEADGTWYGAGNPTIGFVANTSGLPTISDTVFNPVSISSSYSAALPTPAIEVVHHVRAYVTYELGTFYSTNELQEVSYTLSFSRRTSTDVSDPPNYVDGEPKSPNPSQTDGEVYFDIGFTGKTGGVTATGIVSSTSPGPTTSDDVVNSATGTDEYGISFPVSVGTRYFRAFNELSTGPIVYSDNEIEFTMEDVRGSVVITGVGVIPPFSFEISLSGEIHGPTATPTSAGFDWISWYIGDIPPEPEDPYYGSATFTQTVSLVEPTGPGEPWTFSGGGTTPPTTPGEHNIKIRPWAVINGIKYWAPLISSTY